MSKSSPSKNDFIMYRLDLLEKRIDQIEQAIRNGSNGNNTTTELLHIILDMIKHQSRPVKPVEGKKIHKEKDEQVDSTQEQDLGAFEALACMARRRTII